MAAKLQRWGYIFLSLIRGCIYRIFRVFNFHVYIKHAISDSLEHAKLTYAMVWEDARTLREALHIQPDDDVICVASGGDNALALLLDNPRHIHAVDYSPAQVALCELKQCAIEVLDHAELLRFLGIGPTRSPDAARLQTYESKLKPRLAEDVAAFWDANLPLLEAGVLYGGIYGKFFLDFAELVRPLILSDKACQELLKAESLEQQRALFRKHCQGSFRWRWVCRAYFGDVLVGRCPPFYEKSDVNIGEHFYERLSHAFLNVPIKDNYYLEYLLTGHLTGSNGLPEYLLKENLPILKERIHKIRFSTGDVVDTLNNEKKKYDVIDLSNIFDFLPSFRFEPYVANVLSYIQPGGRICHWTFVPVVMKESFEAPFSKDMSVDITRSRHLNDAQRAWFYQTFTIQTAGKNALVKNGYKGLNSH